VEIVYRAAVLYLFLFFLMRVLGKKELGQMSAFELVLLLAMGDLVQQGVTQEDYSVTGAMLAIGTFGVLILVGSYVTFRFPRSRPVLEGVPAVVVQDGRLREDVMRLERLTDTEVREALREQGIEDLRDVKIGLLEADGKFSFFTTKADSDKKPAPDKAAT
jgi:uncharacterized membrane protein YcaP (DUF421 family)